MIKQLISTLLLIFLINFYSIGQSARHVILITIDGFRPDFYLDPSWGAVNLRQLMAEGVYAKGVNSVFPSVTYPSHTTIITGAKPATHGIYFNNPFEPRGATGRWNWEFKTIKSPTLWEVVRKNGLTSASVFWPVSVGAPVDYNIPVIRPVEDNVGRFEIISRNAKPKGLLEELEKYATGELEANAIQQDDNVARMASYLIEKYKPNLVTIHLVDVDHAEHVEGRNGKAVRKAVAVADRAVGVIIEAVDKAGIKENTDIIITGDHGFVNKHTRLYPNVWLAQAGLMGNIKEGEWKARFHPAGGSAFLHLKNKGDKKNLDKIKQLLSALPESQKKLFRVVDREELEKVGADPDAALALAAVPGIVFGGAAEGEQVRATNGGAHGYFPDFPEIQTGFIGYGLGFRKGAVIPVMKLEDIAPLVARLLNLDFKAPDGILYPGVLSK